MRALVFLRPGLVELQSVPVPAVASGDTVVKVRAAGICGSEIEAFLGRSSRRLGPLILGHEVAGEVVAGDSFPPGTRVIVNPLIACGVCRACGAGQPQRCSGLSLVSADLPGGHAEFLRCPSDNLLALPDDMDFALASLAEPAATAIHGVDNHIGKGDHALVLGSGAIGIFAAQWSIAAGGQVDVVDPLPSRRSASERIGARGVGVESLEPRCYDVVIDTVGSRKSRETALTSARNGGSVVMLGLRDDESPFAFSTLVRREVSMLGSYGYRPDELAAAVLAIAQGRLQADFITQMALEDGPRAFDLVAHQPEIATKVVLVP